MSIYLFCYINMKLSDYLNECQKFTERAYLFSNKLNQQILNGKYGNTEGYQEKTVQDLGEVMKRDQEKNNLLGHENQNLVNVHVGGFCHDHQNRLKD